MGKNHEVKLKAMLDCGASTLFISQKVVERKHLPRRKLPEPIHLQNVDLTENKIGQITHEVELDLQINKHITRERFLIADIGKDDVIIGIDWLKKHNPEIDWSQGRIVFSRCPSDCQRRK
jgi:predicted aspartyl protease